MRADAKVYILQDENNSVISVNASLKNLIEKMVQTRRFSRSAPDRKTTMATLKANKPSIHPLKDGTPYSITFKQLGDINDQLIPEITPTSCNPSIFKAGELDYLVTEELTDEMIEILTEEVA